MLSRSNKRPSRALMRDDPAAAQTGDAMYQMLKDTALGFIDDEALSRGAAIAFYTVTSLAPVLLVVIGIAGLVFGQEAAQGAILDQLSGLMGRQAADVLQAALASAEIPVGWVEQKAQGNVLPAQTTQRRSLCASFPSPAAF